MSQPDSSPLRLPLLGILAWLVPGAAHMAIGERVRGIIILVVIAVTFWGGVAIGGVKGTVTPGTREDRSLWFLAQVCTGIHPLIAVAWSSRIEVPPSADQSQWIASGQTKDIAVVYTAICGMLNILVIFDVLTRAERQEEIPERMAAARAAGGGAT